MYNAEITSELKRLNFEDFLWIIFAILCIANVFGDRYDKEYLVTHNKNYQDESNKIFEITLIITFFIYIYFFVRNYHVYETVSEEQKTLYLIKVLGSSFLLAGVIRLIYFQTKHFHLLAHQLYKNILLKKYF